MSKYEPWSEPKKIKKELYPFLKELNENYPDGKIFASDWDGDSYNEDLGYFTELLEYEKPTAFLRAYGFHILKGSKPREAYGYDGETDEPESRYPEDEDEPEQEGGKKSGKALVAILIILFLLAAAAVAAYYFLMPMLTSGGETAPQNPVSSVFSGFTDPAETAVVPTVRPEQNTSAANIQASPATATPKPAETQNAEESSETAGASVTAEQEEDNQPAGLSATPAQGNNQSAGIPVAVVKEDDQTSDIPVTVASDAGQTAGSKKIALQYGDVGYEVGQLQQLLANKGYLSGGIDGEYGSMTREAVKSFQKANGFEATGNITEEELSLLKGETAKQ